jgi:hypothetical protein
MKRILITVLAALVVLQLVACRKREELIVTAVPEGGQPIEINVTVVDAPEGVVTLQQQDVSSINEAEALRWFTFILNLVQSGKLIEEDSGVRLTVRAEAYDTPEYTVRAMTNYEYEGALNSANWAGFNIAPTEQTTLYLSTAPVNKWMLINQPTLEIYVTRGGETIVSVKLTFLQDQYIAFMTGWDLAGYYISRYETASTLDISGWK